MDNTLQICSLYAYHPISAVMSILKGDICNVPFWKNDRPGLTREPYYNENSTAYSLKNGSRLQATAYIIGPICILQFDQ